MSSRSRALDLGCIGCGEPFIGFSRGTKYCALCREHYNESLGNETGKAHSDSRGHYKGPLKGMFGDAIDDKVVHHIDLNPQNNSLNNFAIMDMSTHAQFHSLLRHANVIHRNADAPLESVHMRTYLTAYRVIYEKDISVIETSPALEEEFQKLSADYAKKEYKCTSCQAEITSGATRCFQCSNLAQRKCERPSKEQLMADLSTMTWSAIGRKYGVSDNAIRKWAVGYGLR